MISRVLEWHRIVSVKPSPDTIDRRTTAITNLVKAFDDAEWDVVLRSVAGVVVGFDQGRAQDSAEVALIVQTLKAHDSTLPQDLTENALELRAAAATALGEIVARNADKYPDEIALVVAAALESGLGLRPRPKQRYLKAMLDELSNAAQSTLARAQEIRRRRTTTGRKILSMDENPAAEPAAAIKLLTAAVKAMAKDFAQQSALDREELAMLWWLFPGASTTFAVPLASLAPGKAALTVGVEVANLCLLPPPANVSAFVRRAMEQIPKAEAKRPLEKQIAETDSLSRSLLNSNGEDQSLVDDCPTLFPISWLCARLEERGVTTGWGAEFLAKTGLDPSSSIDAFGLAGQASRERVAQRLYSSRKG